MISLFVLNISKAQTSYIQVNGEPGLSVYLNNLYKGKTTAELNGYIIENVTPGNNLIKIVKEGYTPYEETINVKKGEVFEYKVKPFQKRVVSIMETGNSGETDKKADIPTGTLVIQSVPIQIKISMPAIEGVDDLQKNKDKWTAENLAAGSYKITFSFNNKQIQKEVKIIGSNTTTVFVNMLSGEYKEENTYAAKMAAQAELKEQIQVVDEICRQYKFKSGLSIREFTTYNPEAAFLFNNKSTMGYQAKKTEVGPSYAATYEYLGDEKNEVSYYNYTVFVSKNQGEAESKWKEMTGEFKEKFKARFITYQENSSAGGTFTVAVPGSEVDSITWHWAKSGKLYKVYINFSTQHRIYNQRKQK